MKFKTDFVFILLAILLIFVGGVASVLTSEKSSSVMKNSDVVKVGAIIPVEASAQSKALLLGIELAKKDIAGFREGKNLPSVEVLVRDSKLDPELGRSIAEELLSSGVGAIYSSHTVVTRAVTEVSKENNTPLFYDSCNCGFAEENSSAFQMYFDPRKECREISEDFYAKGVRKAGFIGQDVPYGEFCYGEVQEVFGKDNVFIELEEAGVLKNYGFLLSGWKREGVGVVLSIPAVQNFPFLFERNLTKEINLPIACFEGACLTEEIKSATPPEALANVIGFGFEIDPEFERLVLGEDSSFGRADVVASAVSHDAVMHAWYLGAECGNDTECIRNSSRSATYPTAVKSRGFDDDNILIYESHR